MELRRFEQDRYYRPTDPELAIFGAVSTLAQWRHAGMGPDYVRFGNRILYRGDALNAFLDAHTVSYAQSADEAGPAGAGSGGMGPGCPPPSCEAQGAAATDAARA